jgi:hypothetical protein
MFCVDTCCRKETDSESDEEPPTAKEQPTDTQPKGPGSVKDGGGTSSR